MWLNPKGALTLFIIRRDIADASALWLGSEESRTGRYRYRLLDTRSIDTRAHHVCVVNKRDGQKLEYRCGSLCIPGGSEIGAKVYLLHILRLPQAITEILVWRSSMSETSKLIGHQR